MAQASDYGINFPWGATSAPYTPARPHKGDDRPCPTGTPIIINGVTIGLTGATGYVFGSHLHIQEWNGNYANTRKPQNAFKPGTVTNIDPNGTQGDGSFGKFITIRTADGWNDTYCHLSQINVSVGQVISNTGSNEDMITANDVARVRILMSEVEGWDMNNIHTGKDDGVIMGAWQGHTWGDMIDHCWGVQPTHRGHLINQINSLNEQIAQLASRPTQAQVDALKESALQAQAKADAAEKVAADAKASTDKLLEQAKADQETGNSFLRWLGSLINKN